MPGPGAGAFAVFAGVGLMAFPAAAAGLMAGALAAPATVVPAFTSAASIGGVALAGTGAAVETVNFVSQSAGPLGAAVLGAIAAEVILGPIGHALPWFGDVAGFWAGVFGTAPPAEIVADASGGGGAGCHWHMDANGGWFEHCP
jgi:hypothetical protein